MAEAHRTASGGVCEAQRLCRSPDLPVAFQPAIFPTPFDQQINGCALLLRSLRQQCGTLLFRLSLLQCQGNPSEVFYFFLDGVV